MLGAGKKACLSGDELVTAVVRSPHGLNGFVKVESTSGEVAHIEVLSSVFLRFNRDNSEVFEYSIEKTGGSPSSFLLKFAGINNPEDARRLTGAEVLVPRDKACPLNEGEFYVGDLCQCVLVYDGSPAGRIVGVTEGGGGDLLEVELPEGRTCLVPFKDAFIGDIDLGGRTVRLLHRWILE